MGLEELAAPCRGAAVVGKATEITGNEAEAVRIIVARENCVVLRRRPVDAAIIAVVVILYATGAEIVVCLRKCAIHGCIWFREKSDEAGDDRIDSACRDFIVGKRLSG